MIYPNTQRASLRIGKQGSSFFETNKRNAVDAQADFELPKSGKSIG